MTRIPVTDQVWTFDPDRTDGGVLVDSVDADMPEVKRGARFALDLVFYENTRDTPTDAGTAGGTAGGPSGFTVGASTGATVGSPSSIRGHIQRYRRVREYTRYAGTYELSEAIDGTPRVSEYLPSDATVSSIIVRLSPGAGQEATPGLWVVIDDVDDLTVFVADMARLSVTVRFLALGSEYRTRSDLKNDLGSDLG